MISPRGLLLHGVLVSIILGETFDLLLSIFAVEKKMELGSSF